MANCRQVKEFNIIEYTYVRVRCLKVKEMYNIYIYIYIYNNYMYVWLSRQDTGAKNSSNVTNSQLIENI